MGKHIEKIPGFEGQYGKYPTPIGFSIPAEYLKFVEDEMKRRGITASVQLTLKVLLMREFPTPGNEEEVENFYQKMFGHVTEETEQTEETEKTDQNSRAFKLRLGGLVGPKDETTREKGQPLEAESSMDDGNKAVAKLTQHKVIVEIQDESGTVLMAHEWARNQFYSTREFIVDQAKGLAALNYERLELDKEEMAEAIAAAVEDVFIDYEKGQK